MILDAIALEHTTELDRVYPPMEWRAVWSDGENIPLGLTVPLPFQHMLRLPDYYRRGLWLFSDEGHGQLINDLDITAHGHTVLAWNRKEAEARLREALKEEGKA